MGNLGTCPGAMQAKEPAYNIIELLYVRCRTKLQKKVGGRGGGYERFNVFEGNVLFLTWRAFSILQRRDTGDEVCVGAWSLIWAVVDLDARSERGLSIRYTYNVTLCDAFHIEHLSLLCSHNITVLQNYGFSPWRWHNTILPKMKWGSLELLASFSHDQHSFKLLTWKS